MLQHLLHADWFKILETDYMQYKCEKHYSEKKGERKF